MANENQSKEEQIGFHKGSLTTLAKERMELAKILNVVEQLMQMHLKELKGLGVDLESQAKELMEKQKGQTDNSNKKIDDLL